MATKNSLNFWLDVASLLAMLGLALTGGLIHYVLPPGTGHSHAILGLGRHDIGRIHFYLAVAALLLVTAHVWLDWRWICHVAVRRTEGGEVSPRARAIWGLVLAGAIALVLGGGLWWASGQIERTMGMSRMQASRDMALATVFPATAPGGQRPDLDERRDVTPGPTPSQGAPLGTTSH